jgi:hypothetical protein
MAKPPPTCATNAFQGYENSRKYASSVKDGETLASRRYSVYVYPVYEHNFAGDQRNTTVWGRHYSPIIRGSPCRDGLCLPIFC